MTVVHIRMTVIICDLKRSRRRHKKIPGLVCARAAVERREMAHPIVLSVLTFAHSRHVFRLQTIRLRLGFMRPSRSVLQPKIHFPGIIGTGIVHDARPRGSTRIQRQIDATVFIKICPATAIIFFHGQKIALDDDIMPRAARPCVIHIHIDRAAVRRRRQIAFRGTLRRINRHIALVGVNCRQFIRRLTIHRIVRIRRQRHAAYRDVQIPIDINRAALPVSINPDSHRSPTRSGVAGT